MVRVWSDLPSIGADHIVLLGIHRGARGRGGFGHRTQDRKYTNGHGPHRHPAPDLQLYTPNRLVYPGPPQNPHPHPPVNPSVFYNLPYQQGYGRLPQASHLYNQHFSAPPPPANQNQNTGTPWQGFEWEALNGPCRPFSRERYSQTSPPVDTLLHPQNRFPVNAVRHPPRFEVRNRQPDLDNLYEEGVHLNYMDFDPGESNPKPGGLHHHSTNIGTQPQTARSQSKHTMPKDTSFAKSPPSFNRLSASAGAASSSSLKPSPIKLVQQPIDRVMILQQRPDAPRLSNTGPSTTPNNNSLYNRQLDFTPSLLSQPPTEYVLDATFRRIEARDAARKMDAIQTKQTTTDGTKAPSVLLVVSKQELVTRREKGHQENSASHKTLRPPQAGLTTATIEKRSHPSKSVTTTVGSCITVKGTPEKASRSERHLHEPSTQTGRAFPASYGDNTSSDMILDGVKDVNGPGVMDTDVYESEKWGGGRLIPSGLKVARLKDEAVDLKTTDPAATPPFSQNLTNVGVPAVETKSPANCGALRCSRSRVGAKGQWKGYVLAEDCPPTSKGKLLLLDAPPALLPQRSTRSGKVFKPPEGEGRSSSERSGDDDSDSDSEEERRVNRSRRSREVARKHILSSEDSDE